MQGLCCSVRGVIFLGSGLWGSHILHVSMSPGPGLSVCLVLFSCKSFTDTHSYSPLLRPQNNKSQSIVIPHVSLHFRGQRYRTDRLRELQTSANWISKYALPLEWPRVPIWHVNFNTYYRPCATLPEDYTQLEREGGGAYIWYSCEFHRCWSFCMRLVWDIMQHPTNSVQHCVLTGATCMY